MDRLQSLEHVVRSRTVVQHTPGVGGWIALVATGAITPATLVGTVWLLWSYVPGQAAALADLGTPLPLTARITIAASSWFVRMVPFAIVSLILVGPLLLAGATVLMVALEPWWRAARVFIVIGLIVSTLGCATIVFVFTSIQAAHRVAAAGPKLEAGCHASGGRLLPWESVPSNKAMKLTRLSAAPGPLSALGRMEAPPNALRRFAPGRTASQLIAGVRPAWSEASSRERPRGVERETLGSPVWQRI